MWKLRNIIKKYPDFILNIENLSGYSNEIIGFIGPNGAGKTTTINILSGLLKPDSGEIEIFGKQTESDFDANIYNNIGYVGEKHGFFYELTIKKNLDIISSFYNNWDKYFEKTLIQELNIDVNKKIKDLSKGNLMKVALLCALSHKPDFLILDEPTSGLDPLIRDKVMKILIDYKNSKKCHIFFSSHIIEDFEDIADRLIFINEGKIITQFDKNEYYYTENKIENIKTIFESKTFYVITKDIFNSLSEEKKSLFSSISLKKLAVKILKDFEIERYN